MATASDAEKDTGTKLYFEYDGQTYKAVQIGTQIWMAENLNYKAEGSKFYENSSDNGAKYGRLYNWETAMKVCPKGWHLPTNEEWDKLFRFVDGDTSSKSPYKSEKAGKHLKATSGWNFHMGAGGNGTDEFGFSALPGGSGNLDGSFSNAGNNGLWWSASVSNITNACYRYMSCNNDRAYWSHGNKSDLYSVRCLKD